MIKLITDLFNRHQALRYLFIGGINTLMSLIVYYSLLKLKVHYLLASGITNIFGILEGFVLNALFVFKHKIRFSGLLKYSSVYAIGFLNNLILMYLFVDLLSVSVWIAPLPTIIICTIINYGLVKHFVFTRACP